MKRVIRIGATELAQIILRNGERIGSPDWGIYVNVEDGRIDMRSNAHPNADWEQVIDMYSFWPISELDNSARKLGQWLKSDGIPRFDDIEVYRGNGMKQITVLWK